MSLDYANSAKKHLLYNSCVFSLIHIEEIGSPKSTGTEAQAKCVIPQRSLNSIGSWRTILQHPLQGLMSQSPKYCKEFEAVREALVTQSCQYCLHPDQLMQQYKTGRQG